MKTALIVDNSKLIRCVIKELLTEHGLQTVAEAGDAKEAISAYRDHRPDLVMLDIFMPGEGTGIDVLLDIRRQNPDAKVLIVTDSREENVRREALAGGAAAVLCKPLSSADFKAAFDKLGPAGGAAAAPAKRRALVVDDSPVMRALVAKLLVEEGYEVAGEAGDVQDGIAAYERLQPDLMTLDLVMPGGTGRDVLKAVRKKHPAAQVIVVTSVAQQAVTDELLDLGAGAVLSKPLNPVKFRAALVASESPAAARKPAAFAPAPEHANAQPGDGRGGAPPLRTTGAAALEGILRDGSGRGAAALGALFKVPWTVAGDWVHAGALTDGALGAFDARAESVAVRMTVQGAMPAVCLFLVARDSSEKIAELLAPGSLGSADEESARLVAMEWANILMTTLLNSFAAANGSAIISSPPEFDEAAPADLVTEAARKLGVEPGSTFLARSRFASAGLDAACETVLILPVDAVSRLTFSAPAG